MIYELFWMGTGALLAWAGTHIYHNKKFKEALDEEVAAARAKLKERL